MEEFTVERLVDALDQPPDKETLPPDDRRRVRIWVGTCKMVEGQLQDMPPYLRDRLELPEIGDVAYCRGRAEALYAMTADDPTYVVERPKTSG